MTKFLVNALGIDQDFSSRKLATASAPAEAMTKPVQNIADTVFSMFRKDDGKQHLFTKDTLDAAMLSLSAFYKAATHPYVINKTKKYVCFMQFCVVVVLMSYGCCWCRCAKPILVLMLVTLFVTQLLAVPIRAIALAV